jgi:hypothetical protein
MVQVGRAGPQGIIQHQGKRKCVATKKVKVAEISRGMQATLFSLGFSRETQPRSEPHQVNEAPLASNIRQRANRASGIITAVDPTLNKKVLVPHHHPDVVQLLSQLCGAIEHLSNIAEEGSRDMNELSDFIGHPTHLVSLDVPTDDVWELADPILNRVLGFGRSRSELQALVRQNRVGAMGLCKFIEYLLVEKRVGPGLLEGKTGRLVEAITER